MSSLFQKTAPKEKWQKKSKCFCSLILKTRNLGRCVLTMYVKILINNGH